MRSVEPLRVVLGYHRVGSVPDWCTTNTVTTPRQLKEQLEAAARLAPLISLGDLTANPGESGIAVTFDDGYSDNVEVAADVLLSIRPSPPAIFFLSSRYVETGVAYFWDSLDYLRSRRATYLSTSELVDAIHRLPPSVRWPAIVQLSAAARREGLSETIGPMGMEQLDRLTSIPGFELGNHGATHLSLGRMPERQVESDLRECEALLSRWNSKRAPYLAYPFGTRKDIPRSGIRRKYKSHFRGSVSTTPESMRTPPDEPIPRVMVSTEGPEELVTMLKFAQRRARLHGTYALVGTVKRHIADIRRVPLGSAAARQRLSIEWVKRLLVS